MVRNACARSSSVSRRLAARGRRERGPAAVLRRDLIAARAVAHDRRQRLGLLVLVHHRDELPGADDLFVSRWPWRPCSCQLLFLADDDRLAADQPRQVLEPRREPLAGERRAVAFAAAAPGWWRSTFSGARGSTPGIEAETR